MPAQGQLTESIQRLKGGWKKTPECPFLTRSRDGQLFCMRDYELLCRELAGEVNTAILDDIGMNQSYDEALEKGEIVKTCSRANCPSLLRKLRY